MAPVERHQTGVAKFDFALHRARVAVLANGFEGAGLQNKPSIARRLLCLEPQGGDCVLASRKRLAHGGESLRANQRRIREDDEKIVIAPGDRLARGKHRMCGSKPLVLDRDSGIAHDPPGFRHDRAVVWTRHDDGPLGAGFDERA